MEDDVKLKINLQLDSSGVLAQLAEIQRLMKSLDLGFQKTGTSGQKGFDKVETEAGEATKEVKNLDSGVKQANESLLKSQIVANALTGAFNAFTGILKSVSSSLLPIPQELRAISESFNATSMISMASDMGETLGKFGVVFDKYSEDAHAFVRSFGDAVGRSRLELTTAMAEFQNTFVPMGFAREQAADLSKALTKLSVDVASFQNATDVEVANAFTSALIGNSGAVKSLGIVITDAYLDAELMRRGILEGSAAATEQQKVLARLAIMVRSTSDAQDDARRTAGSFANTMKAVQAAASDVKVEMGQQLTAAIAAVVKEMGGIGKVKDLFKTVGSVIGGIAKELVKVGAMALTTFAKWVDGAGGAATITLQVQKGVEYVKLGLKLLWDVGKVVFAAFQFSLNTQVLMWNTVWNAIKVVANTIKTGLVGAIALASDGVASLMETAAAITPDVLGGDAIAEQAAKVRGFADEMAKDAKEAWESTKNSAKEFVVEGKEGIKDLGKTYKETLGSLDFGSMVEGWRDNVDAIAMVNGEIDLSKAQHEALKLKIQETKGASNDLDMDLLRMVDDMFKAGETGEDAMDKTKVGADAAASSLEDATGAAAGLTAQMAALAQAAAIAASQYGAFETASGRPYYVLRSPTASRNPGMRFSGGQVTGIRALTIPSPGFSEGGLVEGPPGKDKVVGRLTRREYIMPVEQTQRNLPLLEAMRTGRLSAPATLPPGVSGAPQGTTTDRAGGVTVVQNVEQHFHGAKTDPREIASELARLARQGQRMGVR